MNKVHILQILHKNTSTLDFTYPYYQYLREQNKDAQITLLVWGFGLNSVFKDKLYIERLKSIQVQVVSLSDYLTGIHKKITGPAINSSDRLSRKELNFWQYQTSLESLKAISLWALKKYQNLFLEKFIGINAILEQIQPKIIMFDQRQNYSIPLAKQLFQYLAENDVPVLVIPHAPHMRTPEADFVPIAEATAENRIYYAYCNNFAVPWENSGLPRNQFIRTGHPSLTTTVLPKILPPSDILRVLYIGRRSVTNKVKITKNVDPYTLSNTEVTDHITMISQAFRNTSQPYKLSIKPHPNTNINELNQILNKLDIDDFKILHTLFPEDCKDFDLCISEPSTLALVTANSGLKTAIFNSKLQADLENKWPALKELYSGFYKIHNSKDISKIISDNLDQMDQRSIIRKHYRSDVFLKLNEIINCLTTTT